MKQIITIQHTQSEHHVNGMVGSWVIADLFRGSAGDAFSAICCLQKVSIYQ